MNRFRRIPFLVILILCVSVSAVMAQDCPALVEHALKAVDAACADTGRNQACYGNIQLDALVRPDTPNIQFQQPGDRLDLAAINALHLSPLNESTNQWGVALLKVQADLPDTLPGQNVTMLLFGDVQLTEAQADDSPLNPMQAFYFQSGPTDTHCLEAPNGLLLQSPPGGPVTTLNINGAMVSFGSTVFVQAPAGSSQMTVSTLAGMAQVQSAGQATVVVQGAQTSLQLDSSGTVSSAPSQPTSLVDSLLQPFVSAINASGLFTPTDQDAAANAHIQTLTDDDLIVPITPDHPVQPASQHTIDVTDDDLIVPIPYNPPPHTSPVPCQSCVHTSKPPASSEPSDDIPDSRLDLIGGLWTRKYGETTRSGDCSGLGAGMGDNGGMGGEYNPDDPNNQAQMCFWYSGGVALLDNDTYRWTGNGNPNTYVTDTSVDSFDNSNHQKVMTVIDEAHVDVTSTITSGSCTVTTVVHYSLYAPGHLFACTTNKPVILEVNPQSTPVPGETPIPDDTETIDPVVAGEYTTAWLPFDSSCSADLAPTFTDASVKPTSFDELSLVVDGTTYALDGDGMRGQFQYYGDTLYITLNRRFSDDFNIIWQDSSVDHTQSCYAQGILKLATADASQPHFTPPPTAVPAPAGDNAQDSTAGSTTPEVLVTSAPPASGTYSVTWSPLPGVDCPAALKSKLPTFSQATITASETSFTLSADSESYEITQVPYSPTWSYMNFNADNSGVVISFSQIQAGQLNGTFTAFAADGTPCIVMLQLNS